MQATENMVVVPDIESYQGDEMEEEYKMEETKRGSGQEK